MTIINAVDVVIKAGNQVIGCAQSVEFSVDREMDEAVCSASGGWKEVSPGLKSWNASFGALYRSFTTAEETTNVSFDDLYDNLDEGTLVTVEFGKGDGTGSRYSGSAYVSGIKLSKPEKGAVTWSATYAGTGAFGRIGA